MHIIYVKIRRSKYNILFKNMSINMILLILSILNSWFNIASSLYSYSHFQFNIAIFDSTIIENLDTEERFFWNFSLSTGFILNSNHSPEVLNRTSDTFNISHSFLLWNIIRFVHSTHRHRGKIKFYIREFICDVSRNRKHRVSLPRGIEWVEKAYLFKMPILPILL